MRRKNKVPSFFLFFVVFVCVSGGLIWFDAKLTEIAEQICAMESQTRANRAIDKALQDTVQAQHLQANDFYISDATSGIEIDAMNINLFCTTLSTQIIDELIILTENTIDIPLGSVTGLDMFSSIGPELSLTMQPKGTAAVDYETNIQSVGINQVHLQIWLNIALEIRIIHPLHKESIPMTRKIMLVDTVQSGQVPEQYVQFQTDGFSIDRTDKMLLNSN